MATVIAEVCTSGLFRARRMPIVQMTAGRVEAASSAPGSMPPICATGSSLAIDEELTDGINLPYRAHHGIQNPSQSDN
jgi:hypothetical protein